MDDQKIKTNQEVAKLISKDMANNANEKAFNEQVTRDLEDSPRWTSQQHNSIVAYSWLWNFLLRGISQRKGLGKIIYVIVWVAAVGLVFFGLSKLWQ